MTPKSIFNVTLLAGALALGAPAAPVFAAEASIHDVYVAAEAGKFSEAQAMMDQVLKDHPNSGTAHFVEAELLAKQGKFAEAKAELQTAEKLAPGLPKVNPAAVSKLRTLLATGMAAPKANYARQPAPVNNGNSGNYGNGGGNANYGNAGGASSGLPWGMILILGAGLVGFIVLASRFMARRQADAGGQAYSPAAGYSPAGPAPGYAPGSYPQQPGYGPQGGMMGQQPGMGSRIMGGLATGAAVGAGIVAGEALMHRFTDGDRNRDQGNHDQPRNDIVYDQPGNNDLLRQDDMGGSDFGVSGGSSWDDAGGGGGGDSGGGGSDDWN